MLSPNKPGGSESVMREIAYLCGGSTVSSSNKRRADVEEHDNAFKCLESAFALADRRLVEVLWSEDSDNWSHYEAAIIGSTWDYTGATREFLTALASISRSTMLLNDFSIIQWNIQKTYLMELEQNGVLIVPTIWEPSLGDHIEELIFDQLHTDKIIVKPIIGACSEGQIIVERGCPQNLTEGIGKSVMLQKFYPTISNLGEKSFIFYGDHFSHSVLKLPALNDYRVQSIYGGTEMRYIPTELELRLCRNVISKLPRQTLYARIDLITLPSGELALIECELIEPYLYPSFAQDNSCLFVKTYLSQIED